MKLFGEGKKDNGQLPLDLVNKVSLESARSVEYNGKETDYSSKDQEGGSGNVKAILNFSRCLVDGKIRELVTRRDVTVEESDFVF